MEKHLHIVTHDVPFPVTHGGLVDVFNSLVSLHQQGVKIHLHCFKKRGQAEAPELKPYCLSVQYYARRTGVRGLSAKLPYIVSSRKNKKLTAALAEDDYPILLGGVHCTSLLEEPALQGRKFVVRLYNVEHKYYRQLGKFERDTLKKIYYYTESRLLESYERHVATKAIIASLSAYDTAFYKTEYKANACFVPVFTPYKTVNRFPENGMYCLYQANLSVNENEEVIRWLLNDVFEGLPIPLVVAGRNPSKQLSEFVEKKANTCLVANPSDFEMQDMIAKSQINILPSFNNTGVKLKLINALFNGRHCLVNRAGVKGSGLDALCTIAETSDDFKKEIKNIFDRPITVAETQMRAERLTELYNNDTNAKMLMSLIW